MKTSLIAVLLLLAPVVAHRLQAQDVSSGTLVRFSTLSGSGSLTGSGQAVTLTLLGRSGTTFQLTGTWTATITFEASNDNTNWTTIYALRAGDNTISTTVVNSTNNDIYRCTTAGFVYVRARVSAYTSGTVVVTAISSFSPSGVFLNFPLPAGSNTIGAVTQASQGTIGAAPPASAQFAGGLTSGATGGLVAAQTFCDQWVAINGTASAQLITGVTGRKIYFCSGNIQMNGGANTVSFVSGTGSVCATGITAVPGFDGATTAANGYSFAANSGMVFGGGSSPFARTTNNADNFCILVGAATRVVGGLAYAIY